MKNNRLLAAITMALLFSFGAKGFAQTNVIKINPLSLFVLTGNVKYERTFADKMSFQIGGYIGGISLGFGLDDASLKYKYMWFGITPEFRYYVTQNSMDAPEGFYVGPYLQYQNTSVKFQATVIDSSFVSEQVDAKATISTIGGGAILGYQFLFGEVVTLDLFLGAGYRASSLTVKADATGDELDEAVFSGLDFNGIGVRAGIGLGFAF